MSRFVNAVASGPVDLDDPLDAHVPERHVVDERPVLLDGIAVGVRVVHVLVDVVGGAPGAQRRLEERRAPVPRSEVEGGAGGRGGDGGGHGRVLLAGRGVRRIVRGAGTRAIGGGHASAGRSRRPVYGAAVGGLDVAGNRYPDATTRHAPRPGGGRCPCQRRGHARSGRGPAGASGGGPRRWRGGGGRAARGPRQDAGPRPGPRAAGPRRGVPGALAARRRWPLRRRGARGWHRHGDRPGQRATLRRGRERRHGEGRHLLPDHGEEAPARAGDRDGEPPAVHLPGGFGRCVPAPAGRGVPRPRPLRADLLQPGTDVGGEDPADRGGDGLVHGRRRLRPRDVGRDR